tara:strand:- start:485 stop:1252 length:768 start_codon:yes stop_codon:yes gene_type:complete
MAKADIWMPFYVADYLSDTMHLTPAEHGGYLMLILHYWKSGPIPDDDARLATISRLGDAWSNASSTLRAFFKQQDGMLVHSRIDREKVDALDNKAKNQARAKAAADKRWSKNATSNAPSMPQALLNECPSPSPSSSLNSKAIVISDADDILPAKNLKHDCPHQEIIAIYHEVLPQCPRIRDWTPARASQLRARWNEDPARQDLTYWRRFFEYVGTCDFLVGRAGKAPFFASLVWMTKSENFTKIRETNYENRSAA